MVELKDSTRKAKPPCPICGKPRDERYRPFCSPACRDRDLIKWLDGAYAVPAVETDDVAEEELEKLDPERDR
jgi:endogenous inhibitor of DNA gyrase (YacG/DUF329 family)